MKQIRENIVIWTHSWHWDMDQKFQSDYKWKNLETHSFLRLKMKYTIGNSSGFPCNFKGKQIFQFHHYWDIKAPTPRENIARGSLSGSSLWRMHLWGSVGGRTEKSKRPTTDVVTHILQALVQGTSEPDGHSELSQIEARLLAFEFLLRGAVTSGYIEPFGPK